MNINQGLKEIRSFKNELKRLIKIRKENFYIIIPKEQKIEEAQKEIEFNTITDEIKDLSHKISVLREKILKTNINTKIEIDNNTISISLLKLMIDDLRSELAQIQNLNDDSSSWSLRSSGRRRQISTKELEEKEVPQLNDMGVEKIVKELEEKKNHYEGILDKINNKTEIED